MNVTTTHTYAQAALAGFAHGMKDFWPDQPPGSTLDATALARAERLARGAESVLDVPPALTAILSTISFSGSDAKPAHRFVPLASLQVSEDVLFPTDAPRGNLNDLKQRFQDEVRAHKQQQTPQDRSYYLSARWTPLCVTPGASQRSATAQTAPSHVTTMPAASPPWRPAWLAPTPMAIPSRSSART